MANDNLPKVAADVVSCTRCPRLRAYCTEIARVKRRAFRDQEYWGRPVPGFGDPRARLLIVGLAPAAHGGNRTGRMFTGDASAAFLMRALHKAGFATQPTSIHRHDGLRLRDAYVTAVARCAPPGNKPLPAEIAACSSYLVREIGLLTRVKVVVALGKIAFDGYLAALRAQGRIDRSVRPRFGHGVVSTCGPGLPALVASYHPSQQNTNTGKLTERMFDQVFSKASRLLD